MYRKVRTHTNPMKGRRDISKETYTLAWEEGRWVELSTLRDSRTGRFVSKSRLPEPDPTPPLDIAHLLKRAYPNYPYVL